MHWWYQYRGVAISVTKITHGAGLCPLPSLQVRNASRAQAPLQAWSRSLALPLCLAYTRSVEMFSCFAGEALKSIASPIIFCKSWMEMAFLACNLTVAGGILEETSPSILLVLRWLACLGVKQEMCLMPSKPGSFSFLFFKQIWYLYLIALFSEMVCPLIELWKNKVISRETQPAPARRAGIENWGVQQGIFIGWNYSLPWSSGGLGLLPVPLGDLAPKFSLCHMGTARLELHATTSQVAASHVVQSQWGNFGYCPVGM